MSSSKKRVLKLASSHFQKDTLKVSSAFKKCLKRLFLEYEIRRFFCCCFESLFLSKRSIGENFKAAGEEKNITDHIKKIHHERKIKLT